jgi:tryptophanyl-tRNA synthetase
MSWKDLKDATAELLDEFLREPRRRYRELMADRGEIARVLRAGAERARPEAVAMLGRVRTAIGRESFGA